MCFGRTLGKLLKFMDKCLLRLVGYEIYIPYFGVVRREAGSRARLHRIRPIHCGNRDPPAALNLTQGLRNRRRKNPFSASLPLKCLA
jgi:hypothetical protein